MPDETGDILSLPLVQQTSNLGVIFNSEFKSSTQVTTAASKKIAAILSTTFSNMHLVEFHLTYSTLVHLQLDYGIQSWSPNLGEAQRFGRI